jgi:hypothetical protein
MMRKHTVFPHIFFIIKSYPHHPFSKIQHTSIVDRKEEEIKITTMTKIITTLVFLVLVSSLSVLTAEGATRTSSGTIHGNKHKLGRECKDRPHVNCPLIAKDGDCGGHTREGENYGSIICPVSCGQCGGVQNDEISTDQLCYPFSKQVIQVSFANRYVNIIYISLNDIDDIGLETITITNTVPLIILVYILLFHTVANRMTRIG